MDNMTLVLSEEQIRQRVLEIGRQITKAYNGANLVVLGILNGSFIFMADLLRTINLPLELDFIRASSYGDGTNSSGKIAITKDVEISLEGKDVLVVEDIVDTGHTLEFLLRVLLERNPKSLKVCTLINKTERREKKIPVDFCGFDVEKGFLVGYGLDCAQHYRHLPAIYHLHK